MRIGWLFLLAALCGPINAQGEATLESSLQNGARMVREKHLDEALGHYRKALELDPKSATALYQIGWIYNEQHKYDSAVQALKQGAELAPNDVAMLNELGFAYYKLDNAASARTAYARAVELKPANTTGWMGLADVYFELDKDYPKAAQHYARAIEAGVGDAAVYYRKGWCHNDADQFDLAVPALRKATELSPESAPAWLELGYALLGGKKPQEAVPALSQAVKLDPKLHLGYLYLGRAYLRLGQREQARKQVELLRWHDADTARQLLEEFPKQPAKPVKR